MTTNKCVSHATPSTTENKKTLRFVELFAGIGGFRLGLEKVNYGLDSVGSGGLLQSKTSKDIQGDSTNLESRQVGFTCVYTNEFNKYAASIYERHYGQRSSIKNKGQTNEGTQAGDTKRQSSKLTNTSAEGQFSCVDTRDIREVKADEIPDHDLLTAGFPCQSFSIAGKRGGFEDTRGTLFFEIARIAKQKQPRLLLLENVKGLLSHDKGRTFGTILNTLDELGYDCQWQVLNSKDFGVPQNRERVFIIGHLRGTSRPEVFPLGQDDSPLITKGGKQASDAVVSRTLTATDAKMHLDGNYIKVAGTLEGGGWEKRHEQIRRVYDVEGISPTIPTGTGGGVMTKIMEKAKIRRLTPTECERLQGFPDGWTEGVSDTQRYKCLGNAVTTNVITAIGELLARPNSIKF